MILVVITPDREWNLIINVGFLLVFTSSIQQLVFLYADLPATNLHYMIHIYIFIGDLSLFAGILSKIKIIISITNSMWDINSISINSVLHYIHLWCGSFGFVSK